MPTTLIPMSPSSAAPSRASATGTSATGTPIDRLLNAPEKLLFASTDLDEVRSMVGRVMKPHQLTRTAGGERLDARMHYTGLGDLSLSRLRYGATVRIEPGPLESFFLVQMPLCGTAAIESGGQRIAGAGLGAQPRMRYAHVLGGRQRPGHVAHLALAGRAHAGRLSGPSAGQAAAFRAGLPLARLRALELPAVSYLVDCATQYPDLEQHKLVLSQVEQLAASILLTSHLHNYSETAPARRSSILPRHVRRAQDYLQAHAHEPLSVEQLAQVAGVSAQSLQRFREFLGVSPMHYLRDLRMERAHRAAAERRGRQRRRRGAALGFAHMGRFSNDYKARYLETPSQTLRRTESARDSAPEPQAVPAPFLRTESPAWPAAGCPRAGCAPRSPSATSA